MSKDQNNKELGLIDILQIMGQWAVDAIKKVVQWGLYLFFFGIKQWKILGAVFLALVIYSYVNYKSQETQYEASMIIRSNAMHASQLKPFLDGYSNVLHNSILPDEEITKRTGMDSLSRSMLNSVTIYSCIDKDKDGVLDEVDMEAKLKPSDKEIDSLNLCIKVRFNDVEILSDVVHSVEYYLSNVAYINTLNKARLAQKDKRKEFLLYEISLLDTMQQRAYGGSEVASDLINRGGVVIDNRRILTIYTDKADLWALYEELEKETTFFTSPTTVVEDFVIQESAVNTLSSMMKKNVVYGTILVYIFLFLFIIIRKEKDNYLPKI